MLDAGAIDWEMLRRNPLVTAAEVEDLALWRFEQLYMASPVRQYLPHEADLCVGFAAEWSARLLAEDLSPVAPAVETLVAMVSRGEDPIGLYLRHQHHDWWMRRCLPWMVGSKACLVPPIRGWETSDGVWAEASWFVSEHRPVFLLRGRP